MQGLGSRVYRNKCEGFEGLGFAVRGLVISIECALLVTILSVFRGGPTRQQRLFVAG